MSKTRWGLSSALALTMAASLTGLGLAQAQSHRPSAPAVHLEKAPYSGGVLMARAIRAGLALPALAPAGGKAPTLKCSPSPCALPNVQASEGGQPVDETPISVDPNNSKHVLTAGNDYNCSSSLQGYFASTDGGKTFTHSCGTLATGTSGGDGDPVVGWDLNGVAYRGGIDDGSNLVIAIGKSTDFGATWSTPVIAAKVSGVDMDKPWLEIDTNAASPLKNALYVSMTQFSGNNTRIGVSHSTDGGATWHLVNVDSQQIYPNLDQFSDLAIGADGTVYVSWMRCNASGPTGDCGGTTASQWFSKSTDGGATWSAAFKIHNANLAPDSCGAFYGCLPNTFERVSNIPVIAIDNSPNASFGTLYVADYNWNGTYMQVEAASSLDGGVTWGNAVGVTPSTDTHDQFFPWINVSDSGLIGVTWLDRSLDGANVNYDAFGTSSKKLQKLKNGNLRLSSVSSDPFNDGFGSGFMGDYTGNAWVAGKNKLYMSWSDTRNGSDTQDEVGGLMP
jgi:hypothetical protein